MGILGPVQPYLALMVSVPVARCVSSQWSRHEIEHQFCLLSRINFIWTLRALGSCLSTLVTGAVFKSLVKRPGEKLTFLASCVLATGLFMGLVPWASSFYVLLSSEMSPLPPSCRHESHCSDLPGWSVPGRPGHGEQLLGGGDAGASAGPALHPVPPRHGRPRLRPRLSPGQALPPRHQVN